MNVVEEKKLPFHEWLAIFTIVLLLSILTLITLSSSRSTQDCGRPHYVINPEIPVRIEGAVEKPGKYFVKKGCTVKEILENVPLQSDADLSRVKMDRQIKRKGQVIKIPTKKPCVK